MVLKKSSGKFGEKIISYKISYNLYGISNNYITSVKKESENANKL